MNLLQKILETDTALLNTDAKNWEDAVHRGCEVLREKGFVTADYYEGILNSTMEYGPYYVFLPHFAMPHARPEDGVLRTGFCLLTLKEGVPFGVPENDPVDILVILAAKSKKEMNEQAIVQVMEFLENHDLIEKIRGAQTIFSLKQLSGDL